MTGSAKPTVSVLVTVYNCEHYVAETLESILNSKFQDFEVIVVDDHSTDNSLKIAKEIAEKDSRIHVYENERNLGDYNNRNKAASLAKGKYLKFLDADDLIFTHGLSVMVDAMERYPESALALTSKSIDPLSLDPIIYSSTELYKSHYLGTSPLGAGPSGAIIRHRCFESLGGFSGKQFVGDSELWLKLAEQWPIVALPPKLVWWRQHEDQQIELEMSKPEVLTDRFRLELEVLESTRHLTRNEKTIARKKLNRFHARRLLSLAFRKKKPGSAIRLFRNSKLTLLELAQGLRPY